MELRIASKIWTVAWWFMLIEKWHMYMREKTMNKGKVDGSKDLQPKANVIFVSIHSCHRQDITTEMGFCWTYHVCDIYIYTLNMKFISEKKKKKEKKKGHVKRSTQFIHIHLFIHTYRHPTCFMHAIAMTNEVKKTQAMSWLLVYIQSTESICIVPSIHIHTWHIDIMT